MDCIKNIFTGQYAALAWFFVAIIGLYIPALLLLSKRKSKKAAAFLRKHPDAVRVFIRRTKMNDLLTVLDVDGEKPVKFTQGVTCGFFITPGEHMLKLQYQWIKSSVLGKLAGRGLGGYQTFAFPVKKLEVFPKRGQTYQLKFDHETEGYVFERYIK